MNAALFVKSDDNDEYIPINMIHCDNQDWRDEVDRVNDNTKGYLGCDIEESSDEILICEYIYLLEHVKDIRKDYELCLIRHKDEYEKYNKETDFTKFLTEIASLDDSSWLLETEVYSGLANELIKRGYLAYIDALWSRYIKE